MKGNTSSNSESTGKKTGLILTIPMLMALAKYKGDMTLALISLKQHDPFNKREREYEAIQYALLNLEQLYQNFNKLLKEENQNMEANEKGFSELLEEERRLSDYLTRLKAYLNDIEKTCQIFLNQLEPSMKLEVQGIIDRGHGLKKGFEQLI